MCSPSPLSLDSPALRVTTYCGVLWAGTCGRHTWLNPRLFPDHGQIFRLLTHDFYPAPSRFVPLAHYSFHHHSPTPSLFNSLALATPSVWPLSCSNLCPLHAHVLLFHQFLPTGDDTLSSPFFELPYCLNSFSMCTMCSSKLITRGRRVVDVPRPAVAICRAFSSVPPSLSLLTPVCLARHNCGRPVRVLAFSTYLTALDISFDPYM